VWVGLDNYRQLIDDPIFWQGARQQPLVRARHDSRVDGPRAADGGVGQRPPRGPRIPAARVLHADVLPMIAVANIWLFFFTPEYGLLEKALAVFGAGTHNWLGSKSTALACLMVVTVWKEPASS
jgi:sn-glycerol 3-phosphate transport system permease protein